MRRALVAISALVWLAVPRSALADNQTVTIKPGGTLDPKVVTITQGDAITWQNDDAVPQRIYIEGTAVTDPILPTRSGSYTPLSAGVFHYGLSASDTSATIDVKPGATTTTTATTVRPTSTTTTTVKPSTTTAASTTTTATSASSTTSTSTTTTLAAAPAKSSGGGGGSALAVLLSIAALVVAGLATAAYWAWRRSSEPPHEPPFGEPPPTTSVPSL